jgi:TPR repeat protein
MLGEIVLNADMFFNLGMTYSNGQSVPADLVSAHKWFNLAAMHGHTDAVRLRREIEPRCRMSKSPLRRAPLATDPTGTV